MRAEARFFMWRRAVDRDVDVQVEGFVDDSGPEYAIAVENVWVDGVIAHRNDFTHTEWIQIEESLIPGGVSSLEAA